MTKEEVLKELEELGDFNTKKVLKNHGAKEPFFGVKVADLKKIVKKTKKNHDLSLELFKTGNSDAMYLAGLIADETKITKQQLNEWVHQAYWYYLSEFAVPWVAAETSFGFELGMEWIDSELEGVASAGWATLANFAAVNQDESINLLFYEQLLDRIRREIKQAPNRVRYTMNGFVIATGSYIKSLTAKSMQVASEIGEIDVQMGNTACKVPMAKDYIQKVVDRGTVGKKKKNARC